MKKILVFVFLIVLGAGLAWTYYMKKQVDSRYSLKSLQEIAKGANATLPVLVDAQTRLDKVSASEKVLEKHYTLIGVQESAVNKVTFMEAMTKALREQSCVNSQSKDLYQHGVSEWFSYSDENHNLLATIKINLSSCQ